MTELPTRGVLYVNPCPACDLRALASNDGLIAYCQNCDHQQPTDGLTINQAWSDQFVQKPDSNVVYYIRFGDRVKIGTTANLQQRLTAIPYDEVLATETGSYDLEKRRHLQFRASRIYANREWFYLTDEVREHIASLRA